MFRTAFALTMAFTLASPAVRALDLIQVTADVAPNTMAPPSPRAGVLHDMLAEAHRRAGLPFDPQFLPWIRAQATAAQTPGCLIFGIIRTPEREARYRWVAELAVQRSSFVRIDDGPPVTSLAQAKALPLVGVTQSTSRMEYLLSQGFTNLEPSLTQEVSLKKLRAGRVDVVFGANDRLQYAGQKLFEQERTPYHLTFGPTMLEESIWLAAHPAFPDDVAEKLAVAVASVKADGTFAKIRASYLLSAVIVTN